MRYWNYTHAKTERARFWGENPKQTGLQTNELRNEKTPDEAMLPTANKARNTVERAAVIRVVSKGRRGEDRKCRRSRRDQPGITKEQKGQWTKASTAEGLHWVLERLSNCTEAGRKNRHFPLQ